MTRALGIWLVALVVLWASSARAQPRAEEQAIELFQQGGASYRAGRFREAVDLLRRAYALHPAPNILYDIGRAYEGMADWSSAVASFRDYLVAEPNAPDRAAIEAHIATLDRQLAERAALIKAAAARPREAPAIVSAPPPRPTRARRAAPWIVAALGAGGVAVGGALAGVAVSERDGAAADPISASAERRFQSAERYATGATASFVAGGVVLGVGLVWAIVDAARGRR